MLVLHNLPQQIQYQIFLELLFNKGHIFIIRYIYNYYIFVCKVLFLFFREFFFSLSFFSALESELYLITSFLPV